MFIIDNVKLATRNFKTRKLRTFLTILGIGIGIGTILFLVSLGYGLQRLLLSQITTSDALLTLDVSTGNSSLIKIDQAKLDELANIPDVAEVSPQQSVISQFELDGISSNVSLSAVKSSYLRLGGLKLSAGDKFEGDKDNKVIVSSGAVKSLGLSDVNQAIGKEVSITLVIPKISEDQTGGDQGTAENNLENEAVQLDSPLAISGIVDDDTDSYGFIPLGWTTEKNINDYSGVKIKVSDQKFLDSVRNTIVEKGLAVSALSDTIDQANKIFQIVQVVLASFGIIALLVSAIGMFNTMTITLLERTAEIGIMKSLGASNREIRILFLTESLLIGFLGGMGGILVGILGSRGFNYGLNLLAKNMGGQALDIFYTPMWFSLFIVIFSTLVGFITGIYPAQRAARINPLVALRYK